MASILVPTPVIRVAEGRGDVLHDDTGRMSVVWPDGHGYYFLHGIEFTKRRYFQIIDHVLLIQDIAEREFIEWVDPEIGRLCNAELCQARAFGISLGDWLAVEQQG